jgi:hypothetical protein
MKYTALLITSLFLAFTWPAQAIPVTAYLYEMHVSGTFGTTTWDAQNHPSIYGDLPDSTYPFPKMRGGSFDGTFVYDSWAHLEEPFEQGFPYVSANINIFDNTGALTNTVTSTPNEFGYIPTFGASSNSLGMLFGQNSSTAGTSDDFRLVFKGNFTREIPRAPLIDAYGNPTNLSKGWGDHTVWVVPPSPIEMVASSFDYGLLETMGNNYRSWVLPVDSAELTLTGATQYIRMVPDTGSTLALFGLAFAVIGGLQRRLARI